MAVATAQTGKVVSYRVPAGRHDLLWSGGGLRTYIQMNRAALMAISPEYEEASRLLFRELKKVAPNDPRFTGGRANPGNYANHHIALRKMRDHLKASAQYLEEAARHLSAAWSIYVALYGEPGVRRPKSGKFNPDK